MYKSLLLWLTLALFFQPVFAQQAGKQVPIKIPATASTQNAVLYLPWDYNISGSKTYPLIIFGHGIDEQTVGSIPNQGLPGDIAKGITPYAIVNGDTTRFIVISPAGQSFTGEQEMSDAAKYLIQSGVRIDTKHIYVSGLSAGARSTVGYISHQDENNYQPVAAAVPMSYTLTVDEMEGGYWVGDFSNFKNKGVWAFTGASDIHTDVATALIALINKYSPGNGRLTIYPGGHCCWETYYDPKYRETVNGKSMNIYEWMLQYSSSGTPVSSKPPNTLPTAKAGNDLTITLPDSTVVLDGSASTDPDGSISAYSWAQKSGPSNAVLANNTTQKATASSLIAGTYVFTLTVTDNQGGKATDDITVKVNPATNAIPSAQAGADQTLTWPDDSTRLDATGSTDKDGTITSYLWVQKSGPSKATIVSATKALTMVTQLTKGTYIFEVSVTDNKGAKATDDVTVTVKSSLNLTPVAHAGSDETITLPTNTIQLDGSSSADRDGSIKSYLWTQKDGPGEAVISNKNSSKTAVSGLSAGTYTFMLTVTDNGGATAIDEMNVTVKAAPGDSTRNLTPVAKAGEDQSITLPDNSVQLDGTASADRDGSLKAYSWTQKNGPATAKIASAASSKTSVTGLIAGTYTFMLTVTDNNGAIASDDMNVYVDGGINLTPVARAGQDQTIVLPDNSVQLDGTASADRDGSLKAYRWTQKSGPAAAKITSPSASKTTITGLIAGNYTFVLSVTDNEGAIASDEIIVHVKGSVNLTPTAKAGEDQSITLPVNSIQLDGSASSDRDGSLKAYKWTQISGPATASISNSTSIQTKVSGLIAGTYTFQLTVTDNDGAIATDKVSILVRSATSTALSLVDNPNVANQLSQSAMLDNKNFFKSIPPDANDEPDTYIVKAYPNPFNDYININLQSPENGKVLISLFSNNGTLQEKQTQALTKGSNTIHYVLSRKIAPGLYLLNIRSMQSQKAMTIKLIKE